MLPHSFLIQEIVPEEENMEQPMVQQDNLNW